MTKEQREKLSDLYATQAYEGMDYKTLFQFVYDNIQDYLRDHSDADFLVLMEDHFGSDELNELMEE